MLLYIIGLDQYFGNSAKIVCLSSVTSGVARDRYILKPVKVHLAIVFSPKSEV